MLRRSMIEAQLKAPGRDLQHSRVLAAMQEVPRHEFVPYHLRDQAYEDRPLPIGFEQTISQPYIVAFMTAALDPQPGERILEIGTGSGYQAAILAAMHAEVYSLEIIEPLGIQAQKTLEDQGYGRVQVRIGDGYLGWSDAAPFDAIIVTCAPGSIPQPLIDQLRIGGRMIIPVGDHRSQDLYLLRKTESGIKQTAVLPVRFVPMTGQASAD